MRKEEKIKAALLIFGMAEIKRFESLPNIPEPRSEKYLAAREKLLSMHFGEAQRIWTPKRAVAAILVAIFLLAVTACAAIEPIREFFIEVFDEYIRVEVDDPVAPNNRNEEDVIPPKTIEIAYTISNLPEEFILIEDSRNIAVITKCWMDNTSTIVLYEQNILYNNDITLDNSSQYSEITIDGRTVFKYYSDGMYVLMWKEHGYLFSISCSDTIPWETVVDMVTGLAPEE